MLRTGKAVSSSKKPSLRKVAPTKTTKRKLTTAKKLKPTTLKSTTTISKFKFSTEVAGSTAAKPETEEVDLLAEAPVIYTNNDLSRAAHLGDILQLKACLAQTEPKLNINYKNGYGQTPLIHAIKQRHVKSVQLLVKHGADINLTDDQKHWPPVFYAIRQNSVSLFRTFMSYNPDIHRTVPGNKSPMSIAGESGTQVTILNDLLDLGFSVDHCDIQGKTPLMSIVKTGTIKEVEWFLNQGANPATKDKTGRSAVVYSRTNQDGNIYRLVQTRYNETKRIHKLETQEEDAAVKDALDRIKQQITETNRIKNPKKVKGTTDVVTTPSQ